MATIAKYDKEEVRNQFPKMFALLILEMDERVEGDLGNDVLGEFYETNLYRKGAAQYFTPWSVCYMMAQIATFEGEQTKETRRVLDPSCGSGRTLLAGAKCLGGRHQYYGIDIDHTCVKMAALNLFLNGMFYSEVMCADALSPNDFRVSYAISFLPLGIFRIEDKEKSRLWNLHVNSFKLKQSTTPAPDIKLPSQDGKHTGTGSQLQLF